MQNKEYPERKQITLELETSEKEDQEKIINISKALSSQTRLDILNLLFSHPYNLTELSKQLDLPVTTTVFHLKILEEGGLITSNTAPNKKGHIRWYSYNVMKIVTNIGAAIKASKSEHTDIQTIPLGNYVLCKLDSSCGMASEKEHLFSNEPSKAYSKDRFSAELIWSTPTAKLIYPIDKTPFMDKKLISMSISLELCSEAMGYNENYQSDITFSINNKELGTYTSPGDFGNRYGTYTPNWWYTESTKYGQLVTIEITSRGVFINGNSINQDIKISDFEEINEEALFLTIEVKEDAANKGGINLFGEKFGDYAQGIVVKTRYE